MLEATLPIVENFPWVNIGQDVCVRDVLKDLESLSTNQVVAHVIIECVLMIDVALEAIHGAVVDILLNIRALVGLLLKIGVQVERVERSSSSEGGGESPGQVGEGSPSLGMGEEGINQTKLEGFMTVE